MMKDQKQVLQLGLVLLRLMAVVVVVVVVLLLLLLLRLRFHYQRPLMEFHQLILEFQHLQLLSDPKKTTLNSLLRICVRITCSSRTALAFRSSLCRSMAA